MNEEQRKSLKVLCERYGVEFQESHYTTHPVTSSMMPLWAEGWIGGYSIQKTRPTIYVGCSPEGQIHS